MTGRDVPVRRKCRAAAATITWLMMILGIAVTAGTVGALLDPYTPAALLEIVGVVTLGAVVLEGTGLASIAGTAPMRVNALHSQAVDRLGTGLRIAARDGGGMIQAVERSSTPFALGVQWHPEYLIYARRQRALFRALVDAARH